MLKGDEIKYIINHAEPKVFFVEDVLIPQLGGMQDELKSVRTFGTSTWEARKRRRVWMNIEDLWSERTPPRNRRRRSTTTTRPSSCTPPGRRRHRKGSSIRT